jgi:hypothetical protein
VPHGPWPPIAFAIGVPAILSGIGACIEFVLRGGRQTRAKTDRSAKGDIAVSRKVDAPPTES